MNIFSLIKKDHDEARGIMDRILETPEARERLALFNELKVAILSHAKSEEKIFYQAIKERDEEWGEEVPHFKKEHKEVEDLFTEIDALDANNHLWWEKFGEVRSALMHHMEEEEKEVFKDVKKEIPADEAKDLGQEMKQLEEKMKIRFAEEEQKAA